MFQFSSPSPFLLLYNTLVSSTTTRRRYDVTSIAALIPPPPVPRSRHHCALLRTDHSDIVLNRFNAVFGIFRQLLSDALYMETVLLSLL